MKTMQKSTSQLHGADELNLCEYPLMLLSRRNYRGRDNKLEYTDTVFLNGQKLERKWIVKGSPDLGLPIGGDQDILVALFALWEKIGLVLLRS